MATITILPERANEAGGFRAIAGGVQAVGATAGQALDAIRAKLNGTNAASWVLVQPGQADRHFTSAQIERLNELMAKWRTERDGGPALSPAERSELAGLSDAEVAAAGQRAADLLRGMTP